MIELLKEKKWSGDGWGVEQRILTQVRRSTKTALYSVKGLKDETITGYEVFKIKVILKGNDCFGVVSTDDEEKYPTGEQFGKIAWSVANLAIANKHFDKLEAGQHPHDDVVTAEDDDADVENEPIAPSSHKGRPKANRPPLLFPVGEFSVKELAEFNKVEYPIAFLFLKEQKSLGKIEFVRDERRAAKGKTTTIYKTS